MQNRRERVCATPVCGMTVDPHAGKPTARTWRPYLSFLLGRLPSRSSRPLRRNMKAGGRPQPAAPKGTQYTCPMHPEIVRDRPGSCPICGMALEPMGVPTGDEGPNPELVDFTRRFWVSAALSMPLLVHHHGADARPAGARAGSASGSRSGSNWRWPRRSCCGRRSRSSTAAGNRSSTAAPTCGR